MPRRPRLDQPGLPQHVIERGNHRGACFFADDDYCCDLHWLSKAAGDHGVAVHAYGLPSSLGLVSATGAFGKSLKRLSRLRRRAVASVRTNLHRVASRSICFEKNAYSDPKVCRNIILGSWAESC